MRGLALALLALILAGCGVGAGEERAGGVDLRVTRDFGQQPVRSVRVENVREDETVMRLLRSRFDVETRFGGRFVQSIGGVKGTGADGREDWLYFVNGVEAHVGAAEYELRPRDVVQWDYRRWDTALGVSAIVGAFPQPFRTGLQGKRFPVRVECADPEDASCARVKQSLRSRGVAATGATLGTQGTEKVIRVVVAPWRRARLVPEVAALRRGPGRSGVFARFSGDGRRLLLLDRGGDVARPAAAGTGLVAAFATRDDEIVWAVTGPDDAGVDSASRALGQPALRNAYAVAAGPSGVEKLPVKR